MYLFDNNYSKKNIREEVVTNIPLYFLPDVTLTPNKRIEIMDFWLTPTIYAGLYCLQINKIELERSISSTFYAFQKGDNITLTIYGMGMQYGGTSSGYDIYLTGTPSTDIDNKKSSLLIDETIILYFRTTYADSISFDIRLDNARYLSRITAAILKSVDMKLYKISP